MNKFIAILILSFNTFAYDMYYKCSGEKISDITYDSDYLKLVKQYYSGTDEEIRERIIKTCEGNQDCMRQLQNAADFAKVTIDIQKHLQDRIKKENAKIGTAIVSIPEEELEVAKGINYLTEQLACQKALKELPESDFKTSGGWGEEVKIYSPYYNNYMYITGCRKMHSTDSCEKLSYKSLDYLVQGSVAMGADPYATLAMAAMEARPNDMGSLYLDPIGKFAAMGCSSTSKPNNYTGSEALDSYGTKYVIKPATIKSSAISNGIRDYLKLKNINYDSSKKSYFCRHTTYASGNIQDSPGNNQCCLELPFSASDSTVSEIENALTFRFSAKILKRKFRDKDDPAFRIQRYNGYTNLMGAAEGVPTWRAGLNYYEDPVYGYQAMDYMVNSFMNNPLINKLVEKYSKDLNKTSKSLLCRGKENGIYKLDTEHYHDKHKNSQRFKVIHDKWKQGRSYSGLSSRERNAFKRELLRNVHLMPPFSGNINYNTLNELESRYKIRNIHDVQNLSKQEFIKTNLKEGHRKNPGALKAVDYLYRNKDEISKLSWSNSGPALNMDRMMDEYFKNVYDSQKTIGKVSDYPWRKFTNDELRSIGDRAK